MKTTWLGSLVALVILITHSFEVLAHVRAFPKYVEAKYTKPACKASKPFGTIHSSYVTDSINRTVSIANFDNYAVNVSHVEITSQGSPDVATWAHITLENEVDFEEVGPYQELDLILYLSPGNMTANTYYADISFHVSSQSNSNFTEEIIHVPVTFELAAPPDALRSKANFQTCKNMTFLERCLGTIELMDSDGLPVTSGSYISTVDAYLEIPDGQFYSLDVYATNEEKIEVSLVAYSIGSLRPYVLISNVSIPYEEEMIAVTCGANSSPSSSLTEPDESGRLPCICNSGYQIDLTSSEELCVPCKTCSAGEYILSENTTCACEACPKGFYCPDQEHIMECPTGHFCPARTIEPIQCPEDSFQENIGQSVCNSCSAYYRGASTFGRTGANSLNMCGICPDNAYCDPSLLYEWPTNRSDIANLCGVTTTYQTATTFQTRAISSGNISVLYVAFPAPGFFRFPTLTEAGDGDPASPCASLEFVACPGGVNACPGTTKATQVNVTLANATNTSTTVSCAEGYGGYLCQACEEGYVQESNECISCDTSWPYLLAVLTLIVVTFLTIYMSWSIIHKSEDMAAKLSFVDGRADVVTAETVVTVLKIAYSHLQVVSLLLSIDVDWNEAVTGIKALASTLTFTGTDLTSSVSCAFSVSSAVNSSLGEDDFVTDTSLSTFYIRVIMIDSFPIVASIISGIVWMSFYFSSSCRTFVTRQHYLRGFELSTIVLLFMVHIILLRTALDLFVCTTPKVQGRSYLLADPHIECFAGTHIYWFLGAGMGGLLLYGCGIPGLAALLVLKANNSYLRNFLCKNFRSECKYWESIIALRKVAVMILLITLANFGPSAQGISCLVLMNFALLLHTNVQPYSYAFLNHLESAGLLTVIFSLTLALYSLTFEDKVDYGLNIIIAVVNLAFVLYVLYEILAVTVVFYCYSSKRAPKRLSVSTCDSASAHSGGSPRASPQSRLASSLAFFFAHRHEDEEEEGQTHTQINPIIHARQTSIDPESAQSKSEEQTTAVDSTNFVPENIMLSNKESSDHCEESAAQKLLTSV